MDAKPIKLLLLSLSALHTSQVNAMQFLHKIKITWSRCLYVPNTPVRTLTHKQNISALIAHNNMNIIVQFLSLSLALSHIHTHTHRNTHTQINTSVHTIAYTIHNSLEHLIIYVRINKYFSSSS